MSGNGGAEGMSRSEIIARLEGMVPRDEFRDLDSKVNHIVEKVAEKSVDYREQFKGLDDRLGKLEEELKKGEVAMTRISTNLEGLQRSWSIWVKVAAGLFIAVGGGVIIAILQLPKGAH